MVVVVGRESEEPVVGGFSVRARRTVAALSHQPMSLQCHWYYESQSSPIVIRFEASQVELDVTGKFRGCTWVAHRCWRRLEGRGWRYQVHVRMIPPYSSTVEIATVEAKGQVLNARPRLLRDREQEVDEGKKQEWVQRRAAQMLHNDVRQCVT